MLHRCGWRRIIEAATSAGLRTQTTIRSPGAAARQNGSSSAARGSFQPQAGPAKVPAISAAARARGPARSAARSRPAGMGGGSDV